MSSLPASRDRWRWRLMPRSTTLRIALSFVLLFGGGSTVLLGGVFWATSRFLLAQVDQAIEEDVALLLTAARERGPRVVAGLVVRRARLAGEARSVFLLADDTHTPLAGNLAAWPDGLPEVGWATLPRSALTVVPVAEMLRPPHGPGAGIRSPLHDNGGPTRSERAAEGRGRWESHDSGGPDQDERPSERHGRWESQDSGPGSHGPGFGGPPWWHGPEPPPPPLPSLPGGLHRGLMPPWADAGPEDLKTAVRLAVLPLPGGTVVVVGRDLESVAILRERLGRVLRGGLLGMVALGLIGGVVMSRRVSRRLEAINRTSREIMAGDLSRRVPAGRGAHGDDFDQLAANLNAMLARIETLMAGVRHVSDTIAHDLRTPLARLRNRLESLRDHAQATTDRDGLGAALAEVDGLLATFNALLRIAQVESGGRRMTFSPVDLAPLLADVAELYEAVAAERSVSLETALSGPAVVDGDRDLLFQAFANLCDNAVKYSPEGGRVRLSLRSGRSSVQVCLEDQGPGIPASDRQRVFERFARLDEARATPGNGLGLTMVAAVVEAHAGRIVLEEADGGGLLVRVELPAPQAGRGARGQGKEEGRGGAASPDPSFLPPGQGRTEAV